MKCYSIGDSAFERHVLRRIQERPDLFIRLSGERNEQDTGERVPSLAGCLILGDGGCHYKIDVEFEAQQGSGIHEQLERRCHKIELDQTHQKIAANSTHINLQT